MSLTVTGLTVRYGDTVAVHNISFNAQPGTVTALLGRNGAGKTSTIEACEGLRRVSAGTIRVCGFDPFSERRSVRPLMGVMLQDGGVSPSARVLDTVRQYCEIYQSGRDAAELVDVVGLSRRATSSWRRLSGGERQRMSLALALAGQPEIVFLDEPTAGVDVDGRALIRSLIADLRGDGCCVVLATHDLAEAEQSADHVVILDLGSVVADDTLAALLGSSRTARFRTARPVEPSVFGPLASRIVATPAGYELPDADASSVATLTNVLADVGVEMTDLRVGSDTLEDVFVRLTGSPIS